MDKVIITGGTGFVGSWLLEEFIENDIDVTMLVRNANRVSSKIKSKVKIVEYNPDTIESLELGESNFDVFYHLGWGGVSTLDKNNADLQILNINESIKAMRFANSIDCKRFISIGTVAEYVFCEGIMDFNEKQTPNDMYGASKTATYYFLDVVSREIGIPFVWVVLSSTFGERRIDNNIITYTIETLLKGEKPHYGNLEQLWDFLYVKDAARALRLIGEIEHPNKIYGIGSGEHKPLRYYVETIRDMIDPNLPLGIGEKSSLSVQTKSSCVDISLLKKDTGFEPMTSFEEGIIKTINWFKDG